MNVQEIMSKDVKTVTSSDPIKKAAEIMKQVDCGSVPVVDQGKVIAMVTDRDIVVRAVAGGKGPDTPVKECMSQTVVTVSPETDARKAANTMADNQVRRLPVVQNGQLVGILAIADLARKNIYVSESGHALSDISEPNRQSNAVQH
ncbi:CBS domain-containing protein [Sulfobacillus harzensis]|uniref:CBS domain-containing protein n=1 Tax=Sulfobacillus harzensis TaxID=2729629 RepID=A0A7Y0Q271_9FIRM|nr:CBS domain-containing protein [Sulfobacillus harzensis]NMP20869.1 CBS domain-containing protein [Sulfobacillus harzensis]